MNNLDAITQHIKPGFVEHVFHFSDAAKAESLNVLQYAILAVIPVVLLNKSISRWIPEACTDKGTPEILFEIVSQIASMFLGMVFIHRIVTFVPTYSKLAYDEFRPINIILAVLMIVLSLQTNLGEKIAILSERVADQWEGRTGSAGSSGSSGSNKKKKSQSQSAQQQQDPMVGVSALPPILQGGGAMGGGNMSGMGAGYGAMGGAMSGGMGGYGNNDNTQYVPLAANDVVGNAFDTALNSSW